MKEYVCTLDYNVAGVVSETATDYISSTLQLDLNGDGLVWAMKLEFINRNSFPGTRLDDVDTKIPFEMIFEFQALQHTV